MKRMKQRMKQLPYQNETKRSSSLLARMKQNEVVTE